MSLESIKPIGVFDSGVGGLSTLKSLKQNYPYESFLYFGDLLHLPYGTKSQLFLKNRITTIIQFLEQSCKAVIIACNTASMIFLRYPEISQSLSIPVFDVISPIVNYFSETKKDHQSITILATKATVESGIYQDYLQKISPQYEIKAIAPQEWVTLIETADHLESESVVEKIKVYTNTLRNSSTHTIILGCTHFAFIEHLIKKELPLVKIVNSSTGLVPELKLLLEKKSILNLEDSKVKDQVTTSLNTSVYEKIVYSIVDRSIPIVTCSL